MDDDFIKITDWKPLTLMEISVQQQYMDLLPCEKSRE